MPVDLRKLLSERVLALDGAKGTMLMGFGLPAGVLPDEWNLSMPGKVISLHRMYVEAGAEIIVANTFGCVRPKLTEYGLEGRLAEMNRRGVELAKEASAGRTFVGASVPPLVAVGWKTGRPSFDEMKALYREQVEALEAAGVDLYHLETFDDVREVKAAVAAIRSVSSKPVLASATFDAECRTMTGATPQAFAAAMEAVGADGVGANCSLGPEGILKCIELMSEVCDLPKVAQPNAGKPAAEGGRACYAETPEKMASFVGKFVRAGAGIVGGCCGTTPEHVRFMASEIKKLNSEGRRAAGRRCAGRTRLAGRAAVVQFGRGLPMAVIGENINPSGKPDFQASLREGKLARVLLEAREQIAAGAQVLDVNVGAKGVDQARMLPRAVSALSMAVEVPLSIDTVDMEAMEGALKEVSGKPLLNSVTGEAGKLERLVPLAKRYGAALVGLTLDEKGIPETAAGRVKIAERILRFAIDAGVPAEDVVIDCLTLTAAANPGGWRVTLDAVGEVRRSLGCACVLGVSNVSHGLPARPYLNSAMLALAMEAGLDAAIINPCQQEVMGVLLASNVLLGLDAGGRRYIEMFAPRAAAARETSAAKGDIEAEIASAVISGAGEEVVQLIEKALIQEREPLDISENGLLAGLEVVGRKFKSGEMFLPQVMLAAETVAAGLRRIEGVLKEVPGAAGKGKVILATVEGDIHDIGKNLVAALLRSSGFRVLDLGKSVPAGRIIEAAAEEKPAAIGLSALMTTTMGRMPEVCSALKEAGIHVPVVVGGAVVSAEFAGSMGATFAPDAVSGVEAFKRLVQGEKT